MPLSTRVSSFIAGLTFEAELSESDSISEPGATGSTTGN